MTEVLYIRFKICIFVVQIESDYESVVSISDYFKPENKGVREFKKLIHSSNACCQIGLQRTPIFLFNTLKKMQTENHTPQTRTIADCNYGSFENLINYLRSRNKEDLINDFIVLMKQRNVAYRFIELNGLTNEFNRLKIIVSEASVCQN